MKLGVTYQQRNAVHWRSRRHAAQRLGAARPYPWNALVAALNDAETVRVIREFLATQAQRVAVLVLLAVSAGCGAGHTWTEAQVRAEISERRNADWYPVESRPGVWRVHTLAGKAIAPQEGTRRL